MPIPRRRKKANRASMPSPEKDYVAKIKVVNEKIEKINDKDYIKFRDYSTKLIKKVSDEIKRKHFKDRTDYSSFKDDGLAFIFQKFFYPKDSMRIYLKEDNYQYLTKTFNDEGKFILGKIISSVDGCITGKEYDPIDTDSIYVASEFNKALETLEIDSEIKKVSFSLVRSQYNSRKEFAGGNMSLKDEINKAFILIRDQYEDYLNKTVIEQNK
jgi:hypothetical protein